jgi:hypothetical protein
MFKHYQNHKNKNSNTNWTSHQEQLLVNWAEKASGYAWMHNQSITYYKKRNNYISIPASIFGYISGTATLITDYGNNIWLRGFIGVSAIMAGIFSNFQQMFTFKELGEQHRISFLRFLSFFSDISCELSMSRENRSNPIDYITLKRLEMDKMLEQSPTIPEHVVFLYNEKTKNMKTKLHKPEIANILQTIQPFTFNNNINTSVYSREKKREKALKYFYKWKLFYMTNKNKKSFRKHKNRYSHPYYIRKRNKHNTIKYNKNTSDSSSSLPKKQTLKKTNSIYTKAKNLFTRKSYGSTQHEDFVVEVANSHITNDELQEMKKQRNNTYTTSSSSNGFMTGFDILKKSFSPKIQDIQNVKLSNTNHIQFQESNKTNKSHKINKLDSSIKSDKSNEDVIIDMTPVNSNVNSSSSIKNDTDINDNRQQTYNMNNTDNIKLDTKHNNLKIKSDTDTHSISEIALHLF